MEFDDMVDEVYRWFMLADENERIMFKATEEDELVRYHHTLGMNIRNHFKLWGEKWTPFFIDGVDYAPNHPDAISMHVIKAVWKKAQLVK